MRPITLKKLTKKAASKLVATIKRAAVEAREDVAHHEEDTLYGWFIECVAAGFYDKDEAVEIAIIIERTAEIDFARYCA